MDFTLADILMAILLGIALSMDIQYQRVPNWLTYPGMAVGLSYGLAAGHFLDSLLGLGLAFALAFPGFVLGGAMRGGDGKLLMALGAILGPEDAVRATLITYVLNLPWAAFWITVRGKWGNVGRALRRLGGHADPDFQPTLIAKVPVIVVAVALVRSTSLLEGILPW